MLREDWSSECLLHRGIIEYRRFTLSVKIAVEHLLAELLEKINELQSQWLAIKIYHRLARSPQSTNRYQLKRE